MRVTFTFEKLMFFIFGVICLAHLCLLCLAFVWFSHYVSKCLIHSSCHGIWPLVFGAVIFVLLWWLSAFVRLYKYCKNQGKTSSEPSNYVAISNHLFKDDEINLGLPCQNCKLIEMGSMACYGDKCPDCGRPPPGKKPSAQPADGRRGAGKPSLRAATAKLAAARAIGDNRERGGMKQQQVGVPLQQQPQQELPQQQMQQHPQHHQVQYQQQPAWWPTPVANQGETRV